MPYFLCPKTEVIALVFSLQKKKKKLVDCVIMIEILNMKDKRQITREKGKNSAYNQTVLGRQQQSPRFAL